jgi:hypothetical protein
MSDAWKAPYLREEARDLEYSRLQRLEIKRTGAALAICDLCDLGRYPIHGAALRRFRRLDRAVKASRERLFSHPLREVDPC